MPRDPEGRYILECPDGRTVLVETDRGIITAGTEALELVLGQIRRPVAGRPAGSHYLMHVGRDTYAVWPAGEYAGDAPRAEGLAA